MKLPVRLGVGLLAGLALVAAACAPAGGPGPGTAAPTKEIKIVSSLPLQGAARTQTLQIVNAITMALEETNYKVGNFTIKYESLDDATAAKQSWDAAQESENAKKACADKSIVAYIGTFNSGAAKVSIPILNQCPLVMVSPANTYPGLTKPGKGEGDEPGKYYPSGKRNYSRVIPADDLQGAVGAKWAKELGAKKVYILHDTELYGKGVADVFRAEAKTQGLTEVGYEGAPKRDNYRDLANKIKAAGADFVYYGGIVDNNPAVIVKDIRAVDPNIKIMGPDGIACSEFLKAAGPAGEGVYVTFGGIPGEKYTGKAKEWLSRYQAKYGSGIPDVYAIYGYEAAKVVLAALVKSGDKADDRSTVLANVMATKDFAGVLGTWTLDANGDTSLTTMSGMLVKGGKFDFQKELK